MFVKLRKSIPIKDKNLILSGELSFLKTHGPEVVMRNSAFEQFKNHPCFFTFVAEINKEPAAYVWVYYDGLSDSMDINTIYTAPKYRKKGVMSKLLQYSLQNLTSKYKFKCFSATTLTDNKNSIKTLKKLGFTKTLESPGLFNNRGGFLYQKMTQKDI